MRPIDAWTAQPPVVPTKQDFTCPACGASVLRRPDATMSCLRGHTVEVLDSQEAP